MKKIGFMLLGLLCVYASHAQIFWGTFMIEKANKEGMYATTSADEALVKQAWELELGKYGAVEVSRWGGVYRVNSAQIRSISDHPLLVASRVFTEQGRTKILLSLGLGDEIYINGNHPKYEAAERFFTAFLDKVALMNGVKVEESSLQSITEKQQKLLKDYDKLAKSITENQKEKERLQKRMEENNLQLEKLMQDIAQNQKEQTNLQEQLLLQQKKLEEAKAKAPKF